MNILRSMLIPAILASAACIPSGALAQQSPPPQGAMPLQGQSHHNRRGFMRAMRGITLSDAQRTQLRQIMQQFREAHPAGSPPDPQARQQLRGQVMNVLTPQQRTQFEQNMQQMRAERRARQGQSGGAFAPDGGASPAP